MSDDHLVLVCGKSKSGKSTSLAGLTNPEKVLYLNCENGQKLPFKNDFNNKVIIDPLQIYEGFSFAETQDNIDTIVIDSLTFMMDMYESQYVLPHADTNKGQKAWGHYSQFLKTLMSQNVAASTKNVIFTGHTMDVYSSELLINETLVKVKGSLMARGVESFFNVIVGTKKVPLKTLEKYESDLLNITEDEKDLGYKHVIQTRLTKDTVNEKITAPLGMWGKNETYIDGNLQSVLDRLHKYYD
jgi:hypothetical protein